MDKEQARKELKELQQKVDNLTNIINAPEDLFSKIKAYSDVCKELEEDELELSDFSFLPKLDRKKVLDYAMLLQIQRLFNGNWKEDWSNSSQYKYFPYFEYKSSVGGLVHGGAGFHYSCFSGGLVYFKDEKTAKFIGNTFINIYNNLH